LEIIESRISDESFSIEDFSFEIGMSRTQLHRKLKALVGKSASQYLRTIRLARAKKLIEEENDNISETAYSVGFSSPAYFTKCFKEEFGYPPSEIKSLK
jgi:AraC-like DNA-binding protein